MHARICYIFGQNIGPCSTLAFGKLNNRTVRNENFVYKNVRQKCLWFRSNFGSVVTNTFHNLHTFAFILSSSTYIFLIELTCGQGILVSRTFKVKKYRVCRNSQQRSRLSEPKTLNVTAFDSGTYTSPLASWFKEMPTTQVGP